MPDIVRASLAQALAARYPMLTSTQRERLEAALLRELAAAILQGKAIALIRPLPDGSFEIKRFALTTERP